MKAQAIILRKQGKSYEEISNSFPQGVPKSTISYWCRGIVLSLKAIETLKAKSLPKLQFAREQASQKQASRRKDYFLSLEAKNAPLSDQFKDVLTAKIALAMLYLAEGSKRENGTLVFGNSSPFIIRMFLHLLRTCYTVDESKLHCTVQCRSDQQEKVLQQFWSETTGIPLERFYKTQVDPRTKGKRTMKLDYKGVCRIDYFSAATFHDLITVPKVLFT